MLALAKQPSLPTPPPIIRRVYDSIDTSINTALIRISPALLDAVRRLEPKRPRAKISYVVTLAMLVVFAVLGADRSTRAFAIEKGRALVANANARWRHAPPQSPTLTSAQSPVVQVVARPAAAPGAAPPDQAVAPPSTAPAAATIKPAPARAPASKTRRGPRSALYRSAARSPD
jgi:hypothetical protein